MPAAIEISGLRVVRGGTIVLPDFSATIDAGSVTGLMGPSGCGKSTLMRAIVGVQKVVSGEVQVLSTPAGSASLRSRVGYVTQSASVYGDLSVEENLQYFARILRADKLRVQQVISQVDLGEYLGRPVATLSGGQRSRVSLAAALLGEPEVLILDEPTVGLDPVLRQSLWGLFRRLAEGGTTLLVSSHVMDEAVRCDRVLLMRDGRLFAEDSPARLVERTGAESMEGAFLKLIEDAEVSGA